MDIGEIAMSFPTLEEMNTLVTGRIEKCLHERLTQILIDISEQEHIPREKLFTKYLNADSVNDAKCIAIISKGRQCTRKKKQGNFCATHFAHQGEKI
jgi:hypothetical protein